VPGVDGFEPLFSLGRGAPAVIIEGISLSIEPESQDKAIPVFYRVSPILFFRNWILGTEPLLPTALQGIHITIALIDEFLCQTGTGTFVRSGAIKN
jgi:hypothetical protein